MGSYSRTYSFSNGTTAYGSQVAFELDALGSSVNNVTNAQLVAGLALPDSKLAKITSGSKVSGTALTDLASIPDGGEDIPGTVLPFASAAEVITGTEAAKCVAPSTVVSHEGVVKGWINFNGTGTIAINDSYNVSGISDGGTGVYTVTWDTDFGSANYAAVASPGAGTGTQLFGYCTSFATGSVVVNISDHGGTARDATPISVIAIGDR